MLQRTGSLPTQQSNNDTAVTSSTAGMYAAIDSHKSSCCHRSIGPTEPSAANPTEFCPTHTSERKAHFCDEDCGRSLHRRCRRHRHRYVLPSGRALLLLVALVFVWAQFVVDDHNEGSASSVGEGGRNMVVAIVDAVQTPVALAFSSPPARTSSRQSLHRNKIDIDIDFDGVTSLTRQGHGTSPLVPHIFRLRSSVLKGTAGDDASESSTASTTTSTVNSGLSYEIRDCQYRELKQVAALVVESFYDKKSTNIVTRNLYKLAELNRLQQNYAYPESRTAHRMLVVEAKSTNTDQTETETSELVGFCDVDARPCKTQLRLPRPYLSDLAVDPGHRRQGLARKLVEASERFILERDSRGDDDDDDDDKIIDGGGGDDALWLWIRVEETNEAAIGLYRDRLGYVRTQWSVTDASLPLDAQARIEAQANNSNNSIINKKNEPIVWTLRKDLRGSGADTDSATASPSTSSGSEDDDSQRDSSSCAASDDDHDGDDNYVI